MNRLLYSSCLLFIFLCHPSTPLTAGDSVFVEAPKLLQDTGAGEGPTWHPQLGLFTSGEGNINRRDMNGVLTVYREKAGSNGLLWDRQGRLVICASQGRQVQRLTSDGQLEILAAHYRGQKFNNPNDVTIDSKNRIYFSDPRYGDRSDMEIKDDSQKVVEGVYRIDPDGNLTRIITHEVDRPNGLIVTADDQYLFVGDNNNAQGGARKLWRFRLLADGRVDPASQTMI
jgi:gluconolactonase